ncbi:5'/3'-nucleotidase SurE [Mariniblastus fucicola]|uniref:5'-nucleotidase SurE n=1 Tax=Mariniblastus fucicola TaxID=980251 RepID=A0A5B9P7V3_9BACT|nr:5'/3'-nucleotidase SurE [Mariniblastus fucicola]QEG22737.1 5'-nucleotidase SurE [Mariniblastus fucicola]
MKILITNDDGFFAEGLQALAAEISKHADVFIVAPSIEQSGISQAITFMRPLNPKPVEDDSDNLIGYTVNGTPADCVKLGLHELCPFKPDLIVSGINNGLNVGVNVCHSGTVGGAFAASMFDVPAISLSVESSDNPLFENVASLAWPTIKRLAEADLPPRTVSNINFPSIVAERNEVTEVLAVPVETNPLGYQFQSGRDPKDKPYFWATNHPAPKPSPFLTDTQAVRQGYVTLSMIAYNPNHNQGNELLATMFASEPSEHHKS